MSINKWGPSTWIFLHTLAAKIKSDSFSIISRQLINNIIQLCYNLPCPECASHATIFWSKVRLNTIVCKQDLINVLYVFHNTVNQRKHKLLFNYANLDIYDNYNLVNVYNNFISNFNTNGNLSLIIESFHRVRFLKGFKSWINNNIHHFELNKIQKIYVTANITANITDNLTANITDNLTANITDNEIEYNDDNVSING